VIAMTHLAADDQLPAVPREERAATAGLPDHAEYLAGYCSTEAG
jgi:hypothetical protein